MIRSKISPKAQILSPHDPSDWTASPADLPVTGAVDFGGYAFVRDIVGSDEAGSGQAATAESIAVNVVAGTVGHGTGQAPS